MPTTADSRTHRTVRLLAATLFGSSTLSLAVMAAGQTPQPEPITFTRHIAPVLFEQCASCHRPDGAAPFSLLTYEDARRRARQIASVTRSGYMPPRKAEPGYGEFGTRRLTSREITLFDQWVRQGSVEGEASELPPAPSFFDGWQGGKPDLIISMSEPYILNADGPDVFRRFVIPGSVTQQRYVRRLEFRPGNLRAVHHANIKIARRESRTDPEEPGLGYDGAAGRNTRFPDGHFLAWTPGQTPETREDLAWRLEPGNDFVVETHLRPTGKPERVQVSIGLYFTDKPATREPYVIRLGSQRLDIPPEEKAHTVSDEYVLPVDVDVLAVQPHAHLLARQVKAYATLPDGTTRWLLYIKEWDFNWQDVYRYLAPVALPKGAKLVVQFTYDNSADNVSNPNRPPKRVTFGQTTSFEMADLWLQVVPHRPEDLARLDADYTPKMLAEDIAGAQQILELDPKNARVHADLAFCYVEAGRVGDATAEFKQAILLEPRVSQTRYATALETSAAAHFSAGRRDRAIAAAQAALELSAGASELSDRIRKQLDTYRQPR